MNEKQEVIYKGLINVKNHKTQFADFRNAILNLINEYSPDIVVMEEMKSSKNFVAVKKLGKFTGILQELCESLKIPYYEIPINSVNALLCEKKTGPGGHGNKFDLAKTLCSKYGWDYPTKPNGDEITDDQFPFFNMTDAVGFGLYYLKTINGKEKK
jgi:hypothetical protein